MQWTKYPAPCEREYRLFFIIHNCTVNMMIVFILSIGINNIKVTFQMHNIVKYEWFGLEVTTRINLGMWVHLCQNIWTALNNYFSVYILFKRQLLMSICLVILVSLLSALSSCSPCCLLVFFTSFFFLSFETPHYMN